MELVAGIWDPEGTCRDLRVCLEMWDLECGNDGLSFKRRYSGACIHNMVSGWFWKPDFAFMMNGTQGADFVQYWSDKMSPCHRTRNE